MQLVHATQQVVNKAGTTLYFNHDGWKRTDDTDSCKKREEKKNKHSGRPEAFISDRSVS